MSIYWKKTFPSSPHLPPLSFSSLFLVHPSSTESFSSPKTFVHTHTNSSSWNQRVQFCFFCCCCVCEGDEEGSRFESNRDEKEEGGRSQPTLLPPSRSLSIFSINHSIKQSIFVCAEERWRRGKLQGGRVDIRRWECVSWEVTCENKYSNISPIFDKSLSIHALHAAAARIRIEISVKKSKIWILIGRSKGAGEGSWQMMQQYMIIIPNESRIFNFPLCVSDGHTCKARKLLKSVTCGGHLTLFNLTHVFIISEQQLLSARAHNHELKKANFSSPSPAMMTSLLSVALPLLPYVRVVDSRAWRD